MSDDIKFDHAGGCYGPKVILPWEQGQRSLGRYEASRALAQLGSVLYAVRVRGEIKIGYTSDIAKRLANWRRVGCELLAIRFGSIDDERQVHAALSAHRARGREWYHPAGDVLALINEWRSAVGQEPIAA